MNEDIEEERELERYKIKKKKKKIDINDRNKTELKCLKSHYQKNKFSSIKKKKKGRWNDLSLLYVLRKELLSLDVKKKKKEKKKEKGTCVIVACIH